VSDTKGNGWTWWPVARPMPAGMECPFPLGIAIRPAGGHGCYDARTQERAHTCTWQEPASPTWGIHDSRGYIDGGSPCDECGACDCSPHHEDETDEGNCIGLSFSYVCLDGGDNLCEACARKAGIEVVECDCP